MKHIPFEYEGAPRVVAALEARRILDILKQPNPT